MGWRFTLIFVGVVAFLVAPILFALLDVRARELHLAWVALGCVLTLCWAVDAIRGWGGAPGGSLIERGCCPVCGYARRSSAAQCRECGPYKPLPPRIDPDLTQPYQRGR